MSQEQRQALDALIRHAPLDLGGDVHEQRAIFAEMIGSMPVAPDVETTTAVMGGVPVVTIDTAGADTDEVVLYLHGGAFAIGSAELAVGLASDLARRVGARAVSVDYRLAPEAVYPAALDDALAAYRALLSDVAPERVVLAGESAGAGLVASLLIALCRHAIPLPAAAVLMSPWADLTLAGESMISKAAVDPALTVDGMRRRAAGYLDGADATDPLVSPVFGNLSGFPPLLIQAGSNEILLDDATRLAARAAAHGVDVTLEVTPDVPHVFQSFAGILEEGDAALASAARFLRAHLDEAHPGPRMPILHTPAPDPSPLPDDDPARSLSVGDPGDDALPHIGLVGDHYTVLVSGEDTAGQFTVIDMLVSPGGGPPPHRHDFEETFSILEGELEVTFRGETRTVVAGTTLNIPANAPHAFRNASESTVHMLCTCSPAGQDAFFQLVGDPLTSRTAAPPETTDEERAARAARMPELAAMYRTEMLTGD